MPYQHIRNPSLHLLISGYACYYCCMPSSPVLLHIYLVSDYAYNYCYMSSSPVLLHIYCSCFSTFGTVIPTSFNILMEVFLYTCFTDFSLYTCLQIQYSLREFKPHPFCCSWSYEMHVSNSEEMASNYTEVLVDSCCSHLRRSLGRF